MKKKNILLVFTGGTIGSMVTAGTINTSNDAPYLLLAQFRQQDVNSDEVDFTHLQPLTLLSENLVPSDWTTLISAIEAVKPHQFDGIIITHGTDTLAFTAAALSCYFHDLATPILMVSSDYPLTDSRANGLANFIAAVTFITKQPETGVFVPYRNAGHELELHQGHHLAASLQLSGDFISVQHKSYMQFTNGQFHVQYPRHVQATIYSSLKPQFSERIMLLRPYPGLDYRHIDLRHVDAVLHDLYHSGTACVSPSTGCHHALPEFIRRCRTQQVAVYLAPILYSSDAYQSTRELMGLDVNVLWNLSLETAYTKLMLAYGNFTDKAEIMTFMEANIAGEHIEIKTRS